MLPFLCGHAARRGTTLARTQSQSRTPGSRRARSAIGRLFSAGVAVIGGWGGELMAQGGAVPEVSPLERGRAMFVRQWQADDEQTPNGDGLGPMYNARSCVDCHNQGGVGGSGGLDKNVDLLNLVPPERKERIDRQKFVEGMKKIHPGLVGSASTVLPSITLHKFGGEAAYGKWRVALLMLADLLRPGEVPDRIALAVTQRSAPSLLGAGLIDSIPKEAVELAARRQTRLRTGVKGQVALAGDGGVGKFGWRGQTASLKQFVMGACANELGLKAPSNDQALDPLDPAYKSPGLDLDQQQCDELVAFVASLAPPAERLPLSRKQKDLWAAGAQMFKRVGCAECHLPKLGDVAGIYTDLLLHDMGPELADPAGANPRASVVRASTSSGAYYGGSQNVFVDDPPETKRQWRTPPLWGVANSAPYLHDGRAATLDDAILDHGGEATSARKKYEALTSENRGRLLAFLQSVGHREQ